MKLGQPICVVYTFLTVLGGFIALSAAPALESILFPIFTEMKLVSVERDGPDRVCWTQQVHKNRGVANRRWPITIVLQDGTRFFSSPIDGRTKTPFSTKDLYHAGFHGRATFCIDLPGGFDHAQAFTIESFGQYEPPHHLWIIDQRPVLTIPVPAASPEGQS